MKHVIFPVILAVTIPLWAAEQPASKPAQQATGQPDSPLVAAAKRANRLNKKPSLVITNDMLVQMNGGRITTTSAQQNITNPASLPPIAPTPEMAAATRAADERAAREKIAAQQKKLQEAKAAKAEQRGMQYENDRYLDDDPAAVEHALDTLAKPSDPPKSTNTSKPPAG